MIIRRRALPCRARGGPMLGADVAPAGNSGRIPDMIGLRPHGLSKADRGLDNVAATGTAMAAAPRLGALVRPGERPRGK